MTSRIRRWMVGAFLLGAMAFAGAPGAQAQYQNYPQNRRDDDRYRRDNDYYRGGRGDFRDYEREIRFLEQRIQRDKNEAYLLSRRYGSRNNYQLRALRDQIKREERELKQLKKDWKRAQKDRRYYRDNRDYRNYRY